MERDLLTNSSLSTFRTCRKRYYWSYILGIRPAYDAKALRMGTAVHAGLDCLKCGGHVDTAVDLVRSMYTNCPEAFDLWDWEIERETAATLVNCYAWRWAEPLKVVASEMQFQIRLKNPTTDAPSTVFDLAGKLDGIVQLEDGRLAVLESKTVGEDITWEAGYWQRLQLDSQPTIYIIGARDSGHDVATVLWDAIRKPTIKPSPIAVCDDLGAKIVLDANGNRVKTERGQWRQTGDQEKGYVLQQRKCTPEEWAKKLTTDIGERGDWYYQRREIPRLDGEIEECKQEIWDLQRTIRQAMNDDRFYRTVSFSSCPFCAYWGLCSSKYDPNDTLPDGFLRVENRHPELALDTLD